MSYNITTENFDSIASYWLKGEHPLRWDCLFVLPAWLRVWWQEFNSNAELYLRAVRKGDTIIGIAPLQLKGEEASFIGSDDVCDYLDFIVATGYEQDFFTILLGDLKERGISCLNLESLRPDSTATNHLASIARSRNYEVTFQAEDVSLELDLPATWEEYLEILNRKQRHEVRRKLRRLWEAGDVNYRIIEDSEAATDALDIFLKLFQQSREDKTRFMTAQRESFFRSLAKVMTQAHLLRLGMLELDTLPIAAVMGFNYNNTMYLYNSGYDNRYASLNVGLISKVLCIKDSIERGNRKFDFLKGAEVYKSRLAGKEIPLHRCQITLK